MTEKTMTQTTSTSELSLRGRQFNSRIDASDVPEGRVRCRLYDLSEKMVDGVRKFVLCVQSEKFNYITYSKLETEKTWKATLDSWFKVEAEILNKIIDTYLERGKGDYLEDIHFTCLIDKSPILSSIPKPE